MKTISMERMGQEEIELSDIVPMYRYHRVENSYDLMDRPKTKHTMVFFRGCKGDYVFQDGIKIHAEENDIVYIPKGTGYRVNFSQSSEIWGCIRVEFIMTQDSEECRLSEKPFVMENTSRTVEMNFEEIAEEAAHPIPSKLYIKSKMYNILERMRRMAYRSSLRSTRFSVIYPGIQYLEHDITQEKSIEDIAQMCGVSGTYFRKMFREYSGMSPMEFRTERKLERAKEFLSTGELNVSETAYLSGYDDVCYFERLFRTKVGMTPGEYRKQTLEEIQPD